MTKIEIVKSLVIDIKKKFSKQEAKKIFNLIQTLEKNPKKGKTLGTVGGIVIKEIKYKSFRFYFLGDGYKIKFFSEKELTDTLLRFVRMSQKKQQQQVIEEIKNILRKIGPRGFE